MELVYTEEAINDLKRLRDFIAKHNPNAALRVAQELISKINLLVDFPHIGAAVKLAPSPETVRDMIFGNYIVRYSIHREIIIVLRIWHGFEGER
ncbi:type II toxin-antitoxin system RelE/ParE family toxin [Marinomonas sp. TW1]|uniref:type II toxin-antitoxin system RelE/ParE family toxin n=1 Tax=Marinomonas sp. TW1 TaxID=1561203 RepID=UPI0007AF56BA|nr:type II toxin-antitoxin system RelE/ParE family toxin [Marinomonas sp. TW1]KZN14450.1 plasmid stabilization protein [Marinomonas sp. TW1]